MELFDFITLLVAVVILTDSSEDDDQREREYYQNNHHDKESFGEFVIGSFLMVAIPIAIINLLFG